MENKTEDTNATEKKNISIVDSTELELCPLGRASMKGNIFCRKIILKKTFFLIFIFLYS